MIYMDVPEEELVKRILLRGKESGRADDASEEVIRDRIKVYHEQTAVVADFYAKQGKFADINGLGTMMKSSTASVRSSIPFGSNSDRIHTYFTGFLSKESRCFVPFRKKNFPRSPRKTRLAPDTPDKRHAPPSFRPNAPAPTVPSRQTARRQRHRKYTNIYK